ncbi:hypothetical protein AARAC_000143 [Aspergillus arachidicola]|uniref:DUF6594 domain-containing protein n=1 Tax=Aspergillus arachidicola TaxID=656916 RepID=A0A2G7FN24_9EURO|nr:hypothetical protein AARAC_000143 [Aspergillus arachidicola]
MSTRDSSAENPFSAEVNAEDARLWDTIRHLHRNGFINLVTRRPPYIPRWAYKLLRAGRGQRKTLSDGEYGYRINLADMHRMYMRHLQARLIKTAITLHFDHGNARPKEKIQTLESTLRKYVQAVQDHEYMARYSGKRNDPFIASSERVHDNYLLMREMARYGKTASDMEAFKERATPTGLWETGEGGAQPIGATRTETLKKGLWSRIAGALVGGAFLVGPMWLLALKQELYLQLGVTTGCVSLFGLLMAWYLSSLEAVFAASLAYAAVLMVFIGVMIQEKGGK